MIITLSRDPHFIKRCKEALGSLQFISFQSFAKMRVKMVEKPDDIIIVDIANLDSFDLTKARCNLLVLTGVPKFNEAVRLMQFGIRGYGNRAMMAENLQQAVSAVTHGQVWMPPFIISRLIEALPETEGADDGEEFDLSERETEVAKHVAKGLSNREIAEKMEITVRTVKAHMTSIFNKTGLRDRVALALKFK